MIASLTCRCMLPELGQALALAEDMGFKPIDLDEVAALLEAKAPLPERRLLLTLDHAHGSMLYGVRDLARRHGHRPTLYVHTAPVAAAQRGFLNWEELALLAQDGWNLGAHTHSHACLGPQDDAEAFERDELATCDELLLAHTGRAPRHFAYPGGELGTRFEELVRRRYRTTRLWTTGPSMLFDGRPVRTAEFFGSPGQCFLAGGLPAAALAVTRGADLHRLPGLELEARLARTRLDLFEYLFLCANHFAYDPDAARAQRRELGLDEPEPLRDDRPGVLMLLPKGGELAAREVPLGSVGAAMLDLGGEFVVWGASGGWDDLLSPALTPSARALILCFADNDPAKQGTLKDGLPVLSPEQALARGARGVVVASVFRYEIARQVRLLAARGK